MSKWWCLRFTILVGPFIEILQVLTWSSDWSILFSSMSASHVHCHTRAITATATANIAVTTDSAVIPFTYFIW